MSFAEAWEAARRNDAQYLAAMHERDSVQQSVPIARASLLPSVGLNASTAEVVGSREFPNGFNQEVRTHLEYAAPQASIALRMPIFNYEAMSRLGQAQAQSDAAQAIFQARSLELLDRTATGYLQVLLAEEARQLADQQVQSLVTQLNQVQQRLQRGEGTRVDVAQTQAALDVARVRLVEADDLVDLARRQLRRITGVQTPPLRQVPADYTPRPLVADGLPEWLQLALRQSPSLQAREQALVAARMGVRRNAAGHLPRLDFVASVSRSQNESLSNLNQTATLRSIGVQLSVPLYNGGGIEASVRQAQADQARAEEELRSERENVEVEVQRHHQAVAYGASRIAAYRQAVQSAELVLLGTRRALEAGLGTSNDVAEALAKLYSARRDLAQARIDYLLSRLRLMVQAGMPLADVTIDLDSTLVLAPAATSGATR